MKTSRNEKDRKKYCEAKRDARRVVFMAMDQKDRGAVEKVAKQRVGEKKDVVGVSCLKDESGAVKVSVDDLKQIWKEHMEKFMNVEKEWSDSIDASMVRGCSEEI